MGISYRAMKVVDVKGSVFYTIVCDCLSPEHNMEIEFEFNDGIIELFLYKTLYWKDYYRNFSWYCKYWKRISAAFRLLFGGYVEMQGDFLLQKEEHIDSFIDALKEGKKKVISWRKEA